MNGDGILIYTLTVSPSIDYYAALPALARGTVCRASNVRFCAGGKGLNVSRMLSILGTQNRAICCIAGFTGEEIIREICRMGLKADFIKLSKGCSRVNIKLRENLGSVETEINAPADEIEEDAVAEILRLLPNSRSGGFLVLSGSVAASQSGLYARIMEETGLQCLLDCTGNALKQALPMRPYLVKPNLAELGEYCGKNLKRKPLKEILGYAETLRTQGAQKVLLSMGEMGAVLITEASRLYAPVPQCSVLNCTGAGDSMLAGYISAAASGLGEEDALRLACACGSAKAFASDYPSAEDIDTLMHRINISEI